jgi:hypothetical protein
LPLIADFQVAEGMLTSHGRPTLVRKRQEERKLDQLPPRKVFSDSFPVVLARFWTNLECQVFSKPRQKGK